MKREIIIGKRAVEELFREDAPIEKIFALQSSKGPYEIELRKKCQARSIPLVKTMPEQLNKMASGLNHQGVIAITSPVRFYLLDDIIPALYEKNHSPLILILDHITDVRNFGAISRSVEIFNAHAIVIPKKGSAAFTEEAIKASAGALLKVPVCRYSNLLDAISYLKNSGIHITASSQDGVKVLSQVEGDLPIAIIMGSEGRGIQKEIIDQADSVFKIEQFGSIESLNVSVAAGIILYEIQKIRQQKLNVNFK